MKHHPLNEHSQPLARAALAAHRQDAFQVLHQNLFGLHSDRDTILELAGAAGLEPLQFEKDMDSPEIQQELQALEVEALQPGITSVPTLYINGRKIGGTIPKDLEPLFLKLAPALKD